MASRLEAKLRAFEQETSSQILVVVGDRMPDGYASIEEYANRTAQAWRAGVKGRDNGAVLFVFVADRKIRLEVGYGLEGALPDALASRIIREEIAPAFRDARYADGLSAGVDAILKATKGEYQPIARRGRSDPSPRFIVVLIILIFLLVGVVIPVLREINAIQNSRTYSGRGRYRHRGGWGGWGGSSGGGFGGGGFGGGGFGGGGFSGGGGSFGGGGASGSW